MAYSQKVVDKFEKTLKNPEGASVGRWKPGDKDFHRVGTGIVGAPACGDVMKLQIKCENIDKKNVIVDAKFKTCLLYTSPSPRDGLLSRMPSSA